MTNIAGETSIGTILREFQVSRLTYECKLFIPASTIILSLTAPFNNTWTLLNNFVFHCHQSFWRTSQKTEESHVWGLELVDVDPLCLFVWFFFSRFTGCCRNSYDWWQPRLQSLVRFWTSEFVIERHSKEYIKDWRLTSVWKLKITYVYPFDLLQTYTCQKGNRVNFLLRFKEKISDNKCVLYKLIFLFRATFPVQINNLWHQQFKLLEDVHQIFLRLQIPV